MSRTQRLLIVICSLAAAIGLVACEDTAVHTTPPAPIDSENAPTVTVDPAVVGPNTSIVVTGQGFPPNTLVELHVNPDTAGFTADPLGQAQTDAEGRATIEAQVPVLWFDGTPLAGPEIRLELITEDGDIRGVAVVPFESDDLVAFLTIRPPSGAPGQQVELVGLGFEPGAEVTVRLGTPEVEEGRAELGTQTVDDNGEVYARVTVPTTWPDSDAAIVEETLIFALVDDASGDVLATASYTNSPEQTVPEGMDTPAP